MIEMGTLRGCLAVDTGHAHRGETRLVDEDVAKDGCAAVTLPTPQHEDEVVVAFLVLATAGKLELGPVDQGYGAPAPVFLYSYMRLPDAEKALPSVELVHGVAVRMLPSSVDSRITICPLGLVPPLSSQARPR
jgi:hypothetical protein